MTDNGQPVEARVIIETMVNCMYDDCEGMIIHASTLPTGFFGLKSGIAGEVLQKFSTYRMKLAIVGDFTKVQSKSLADFIRESNKMGAICFVGTKEEALDRLRPQS